VPPVSDPDRLTFEQCALASGLLTQPQLDEGRSSVRWSEGDEPEPSTPPSDKQLADRLVEMGLLNAWQAKQLLDGRTKFNLGPYAIIDSIGKGGMGQVFKARHGRMGRIVAVKVLPRDKSTPQTVANFSREIRALERLDHPKLVAYLDAGQDGNVYYLVTEYMPGMDLRKLIRQRGPLDVPTAASIVSQVAEGLEYAHAQGIVHRDVKPGNVLVSPEGEAKLSDLGFASPVEGWPESDPGYGKLAGTADYLSPDQIRDPRRPSPAWDIYALGCTLYYAATGKVPFPGGSTRDKARAHCELRPLDPRRLNPRLSAEFVEVMADMMAKEPAERIASAREVITRLAPFLAAEPVSPSDRQSVPALPIAASRPANQQDSLSSPTPPRVHVDWLKAAGPLAVFVLTPLALVGTILLLVWLVKIVLLNR
jgi:serine/threonine protein kinase